MQNLSSSHVPFAELPIQARILFFLNAVAVLARYGLPRPKQSELAPWLEMIWNSNRLLTDDLSDPHSMTALLKVQISSIPPLRTPKPLRRPE
jgi:hypothetical protein